MGRGGGRDIAADPTAFHPQSAPALAQEDTHLNSVGDACESDQDEDEVPDFLDKTCRSRTPRARAFGPGAPR